VRTRGARTWKESVYTGTEMDNLILGHQTGRRVAFSTHLIRDIPNINPPQMVPDLAQSPPLFSTSLHCLADAFGPQYSIHIELLLGVRQPISFRRKRCDFLPMDEIQGVDMCRTMPVRAHSIDIPQQVAVRDAVVELALGIWSSELVGIRGGKGAS